MLQAIQLLQMFVPQSIYNDLMLMKSRQYPTLVPMDKDAVKKHVFMADGLKHQCFTLRPNNVPAVAVPC
eukprot:14179774-Ditylum_brightwellii.AAC.1